MAFSDRMHALNPSALRQAIPLQRDAAEQERVHSDDMLIEAVRGGRVKDSEDPLVRMLLAWRADAVRGT
ncbi:hypothetical protein [Pseudonocardia sp. TRM90224]|uniref:hypothetical protein n=1 Tax=Pseudonocardia sp. TRM90224 TaxID=2812678 RepID=UPI001E5476A9|nr:hypothetical protein [Pseudonocardia sp. TRM90224]